ncbi:myosin phosphatase Rho-interacting protein-like isoform X2 [Fundulus heteroclitus]|uniref:myosin phosphatase Rho-interacting protein-like isoform X2 n=1 Tax=Fundulus heteroclitus TaxID=8078 RepID=UPI00165A6BED|nr:myosin phosphatase Rho-interacting protein-like isoform X2 [Fundulus heteroclitus]
MASKKQRCNEALVVSTKNNKPVRKDRENEIRVCVGGKQSSSGAPKTSGRSIKGSESTAAGSKAVGNRGYQGTRPSSQPAKPALRLRSSRSFSSLQASSFPAAPFMRSSRSLSRLDERSAEDTHNTDASSKVRKGQASGRKTLDSGRLSSSVERISSTQLQPSSSSSSVVSTAICHHQTSKEKKQIKDGVYTLCAMTAGMRRNWVQAVFKNVQPSFQQVDTSSLAENKEDELEDEWRGQQQELTSEQQLEGAQSPADLDSSPPRRPVSPSSPPAPTPAGPPQPQEEREEEAQRHLHVETTKTGESCHQIR